MHAKSLQLCPTICNPMDCSQLSSSVHGDSPGKNTGVGCHALLQGILQGMGDHLGRWQKYRHSEEGSRPIWRTMKRNLSWYGKRGVGQEEHIEATLQASRQGWTGTEASDQVGEWTARVLTSSPPIPPLLSPAPSFLSGTHPSIILGSHSTFWGSVWTRSGQSARFLSPSSWDLFRHEHMTSRAKAYFM